MPYVTGQALGPHIYGDSVLPSYQFPVLANSHVLHWLQRHRKIVTRVSELTRSHERPLLCQVHQIAGSRCRRSPGDRPILAGAKAALESFRAFLEHPQQRLLLPVIELASQLVKQFCFLDQKFYERKRAPLRFNRDSSKPPKPVGNFILFACRFQHIVITRAPAEDSCRKHDECGLSKTLGQGFLGNRPSDSAVAVLKRMDRFKIQMCGPCPRERWQGFCSSGSSPLEPVDESGHVAWNLCGRRCFEMDFRRTYCP